MSAPGQKRTPTNPDWRPPGQAPTPRETREDPLRCSPEQPPAHWRHHPCAPPMNHYTVPHDQEALAALQHLSAGVVAIGFAKDFPDFKSCTACFLQTPDRVWVELAARGEDLEFKFEVFSLAARVVATPRIDEQRTISLSKPISVTPLETESWLDPAAPIDQPTLGSDPVMQFVGYPGTAPDTASATCRYLGGVELTGANGCALVIATANFPYNMHVSGYYEDQSFDRAAYRSCCS